MFITLDVTSNFGKVTKLVKMWRTNRDITISAIKSTDQVRMCFAIDEYMRFSSFSVLHTQTFATKVKHEKPLTLLLAN